MTEFVDTNILLYANGVNATKEPEKVRLAAQFLKDNWNNIFITWQVLIEFGANLSKKSNLPVKEKQALIRIYSCLLDSDESSHPEQIETSLALMEEKKLSYWDANLIAAVAAQGGSALYSEDMHEGAVYLGVRIKNPLK